MRGQYLARGVEELDAPPPPVLRHLALLFPVFVVVGFARAAFKEQGDLGLAPLFVLGRLPLCILDGLSPLF